MGVTFDRLGDGRGDERLTGGRQSALGELYSSCTYRYHGSWTRHDLCAAALFMHERHFLITTSSRAQKWI
jgi:hypothetical protein